MSAVFTIEVIENATSHDLSLAITSIGSHNTNLSITLKPHQKISNLGLSFGHAEYKEHKPAKGYLLTNISKMLTFKTLKVLFERKENPIIDIPYDYALFKYPHISYWSLYCDDTLLDTFNAVEGERKHYMLSIGERCLAKIITK